MSNLFPRFSRCFVLVTCILGFTFLSHADDANNRRLKSKVNPQYPELARRMNITGSVKLEILVASNGQVKMVRPLGGHPLLVDAAQHAVKQWKYEPGPEGTELVEIRFSSSN